MKTRLSLTLGVTSALVGGLYAAGTAFALKSDREQELSMEAVDVDVDFRSGTRTLQHDVVITQGTTQIVADKVVAEVTDDELNTATAWGQPAVFKTLPDGQEEVVIAKGDRLHFDNANGVVTITGNARIEQLENVVSGGVITYNLNTEAFKVSRADPTSDSAPARPRIVIQRRAPAASDALPGAPMTVAAQSYPLEPPTADAETPATAAGDDQAPAPQPETPVAARVDDAPAPQPAAAALGDATPLPTETTVAASGDEAREPEPAVSQALGSSTAGVPDTAGPEPAAPTSIQVARVAPSLSAPSDAAAVRDAVAAMVVFYETYYELGDSERLMSLFAADGVENDMRGEAAIRDAYERLFANTSSRRTLIEVVDIRQGEAGEWVARGTVSITQARRDGRRFEDSRPIELSLADKGGVLRITRMRY